MVVYVLQMIHSNVKKEYIVYSDLTLNSIVCVTNDTWLSETRIHSIVE